MKIKKFNEKYNEHFFLIQELNPYGEDYIYILTENNIRDFLIYKIYEKIQENGEEYKLDEFEQSIDFNDIEELLSYYNNEIANKYGEFDFKISQTDVENVKFDDWMKMRIDSKKYNL